MADFRVVSGMRPTGQLHLGHLHGVLNNWKKLQFEYDCFFFVADWHALTTHYEHSTGIAEATWEMLIDWLAVGINPHKAHVFVQSHVVQHAELQLLLSMMTPLGWLERVPTYKDQQQKQSDKDLNTYGFLGYPVLQAADVLLYKANYVPVGEDQVSHLEVSREIARRFNYLYGRDMHFEEKAELAIEKLGKKSAKLYRNLRKAYQESGDAEAITTAQALIGNASHLSLGEQERLLGYLEGSGKMILPEPQVLLAKVPKFPGLDGQKMSKSYGNVISLRETDVPQKIKTMPTDPARVRRTDPGEPEKCPVWGLHQVYATDAQKQWIQEGCRSASIGCLECKQPLIDAICEELRPIQKNIAELSQDLTVVRSIANQGAAAAREFAEKSLDEMKQAVGMSQI